MDRLDHQLDRVIIVLSTGRTGTKAVAHFMGRCYPQVHAVHEPRASYRLRLASNRHLCGRGSTDQLVRLFSACRQRALARISGGIYLESNPFLHGFLDAFRRVFARLRVVHLVRDPRTFIPSYLNHRTLVGLKGWVSRYCPGWMIKPEQIEENPARRWRDMSDPERVAYHWKLVNTELNRGAALLGDDYIRLRYEDLFVADGSGLEQLADWIGLPKNPGLAQLVGSQRINVNPDQTYPAWGDWDLRQQQSVLDTCRNLMTTYGYDDAQHSERIEPRADRRVVVGADYTNSR